MPVFRTILIVTSALWVAGEMALGFMTRAKRLGRKSSDRGTLAILWVTIFTAIALAGFLTFTGRGLVYFPAAVAWLGLGFVVAGLAVRGWAVATLGPSFTSQVAAAPGQRVVARGPFRFIRHPSYAGSLVSFLGLGLAFGSVVAVVVIFVPITLAFLRRIAVEERFLKVEMGEEYEAYCRRTKRLVPGII